MDAKKSKKGKGKGKEKEKERASASAAPPPSPQASSSIPPPPSNTTSPSIQPPPPSAQPPQPTTPIGNPDSGDDDDYEDVDDDPFDEMIDMLQEATQELTKINLENRSIQKRLAQLAGSSANVQDLHAGLLDMYAQMKLARRWIDHSKVQIRTQANRLAESTGPTAGLRRIEDELEVDLCGCESCSKARETGNMNKYVIGRAQELQQGQVMHHG